MDFLHDDCRKQLCPDCREMATEYEKLLTNYKRANARLEAEVERLRRELAVAQRCAADWEKIAKLGYPGVICQWMDSLA